MAEKYYKAVRCTRGTDWIFCVSIGLDIFEPYLDDDINVWAPETRCFTTKGA